MSTEYHQLPSQQGFMPQDLLTETDPWLLAATSNLSLSSTSPPSHSSADAWAPPAHHHLKTSSKGLPIMPRSPLFEHSGHDSTGISPLAGMENGWRNVSSPTEMMMMNGGVSVVSPVSPMRVKSPMMMMMHTSMSSSAPTNMPSKNNDSFFPSQNTLSSSSSLSSSPTVLSPTTTSKLDSWSMMQNSSPHLIPDGAGMLGMGGVGGFNSKRRGLISASMGTPILKSSHAHLPMNQPLSLSQGLPQTQNPLAVSLDEFGEPKPIEDELAIQNRYKTELCKSYTETGVCRYGTKCQFAHGRDEVRGLLRHPKYKTETCKTFHSTGTCPYGTRCRFIHTRMQQLQQVQENPLGFSNEELMMSAELTPPPGIPVPQWSKSWSPSSSMPQKRFGNKKHGLGKITLVEAVPEY